MIAVQSYRDVVQSVPIFEPKCIVFQMLAAAPASESGHGVSQQLDLGTEMEQKMGSRCVHAYAAARCRGSL